MANILLVSGHPDLSHSLANKTILEEIGNSGLPFTLRRMDQLSWDFDIAKEQDYVRPVSYTHLEFQSMKMNW